MTLAVTPTRRDAGLLRQAKRSPLTPLSGVDFAILTDWSQSSDTLQPWSVEAGGIEGVAFTSQIVPNCLEGTVLSLAVLECHSCGPHHCSVCSLVARGHHVYGDSCSHNSVSLPHISRPPLSFGHRLH